MNNAFWFAKGIGSTIGLFAIWSVLILVMGVAVYFTWNAVVPTLFGLSKITLFQSCVLFILSRLLFTTTVSVNKNKDVT